MSEGFILRGLSEELIADVGSVEHVGRLEELRRKVLCALKKCDPRDEIRLQREASRMERRRWNVGTIAYGAVCGRCDRLLRGMRTEPKPGTV